MELEVAGGRWWTIGGVLVKTFFFPLFVPYLAWQLYEYVKERKYRDCLPGKVVVITGASSGLGEQMAHIFYQAGCKLILVSRRKQELDRVRHDLMSQYAKQVYYPPVVMAMNVADLEGMPKHAADILRIYGNVDILVNNAGLSVRGSVVDCIDDVDIRLMMVNYFGLVKLTRLLLPSMIDKRAGHVVCIGSVQGKFALPFRAAYSASKHAVQAFCDSLRAEVAQHGIKVSLISPGYIATNLSVNALAADGAAYGRMDKSTATGYPAEYVAKQILKAILRNKNDEIIAGFAPRIAYVLRIVCPPLYFWIMARKAKKEAQQKND